MPDSDKGDSEDELISTEEVNASQLGEENVNDPANVVIHTAIIIGKSNGNW